jgi:hypothetical protein
MVKAGDSVPDIELVEGNPGNKVNLSKELGSGLIIGVPAAFSKSPAAPCMCFEASYSVPEAGGGLLKLSMLRYNCYLSSNRALQWLQRLS